jgi:hypothetical protein
MFIVIVLCSGELGGRQWDGGELPVQGEFEEAAPGPGPSGHQQWIPQ